ncbi:MAG: hypothetical protein ACUVTZ_00630 [Armatimonadota bacterium]
MDEREDEFLKIEADSIQELLSKLDLLGLDGDGVRLRSRKGDDSLKAEPPAPAESHAGLIRRIADSLPDPSKQPDVPILEPEWRVPPDAVRTRHIPKGAALRRFNARYERLLATDGTYVHMAQAILATDPDERTEAVMRLAEAGDMDKLARVAERCVHHTTRKQAVDALTSHKAVHALEQVAFFARPNPPPKKRSVEHSEEFQQHVGSGEHVDEDYDEIRNLAVDRIAELALQRVPGALDALKRLVRYDFTVHGYSQFRAVQRLALAVDLMAEAEDFDGLVLLFNQTRSRRTKDAVIQRLTELMPRAIETRHADALYILAEYGGPVALEAEEALERIENEQ